MIIDTHTHIGRSLGFNMKESDILYMMEKYSIDHCIVSNTECATHDHKQRKLPFFLYKNHIITNRKVIDFARKNKGKISVAMWVNPYKDPADLEELLKDSLDVVVAIKFHPFHSKLRFDSKEIGRYIELAKKYSLPVVTHTGNSECDDVQLVYNVAKKYTDLNFVMVHMGLGTNNKKAIQLISQLPNLYGDTTWVSTESALEFLRVCGDDKIVFGSDAPIDGKDTYLTNGYGKRSLYQDYFNEFKTLVSSDTYDKIMYKNAEKLFRLKEIK